MAQAEKISVKRNGSTIISSFDNIRENERKKNRGVLRAAILFYGQARIKLDDSVSSCSSIEKIRRANPTVKFDIYMHLWRNSTRLLEDRTHEFIMKHYQPLQLTFEEQKCFHPSRQYLHKNTKLDFIENEISQMISQLYSVSRVCRMASHQEYDFFILLRTDCEIYGDCDNSLVLSSLNKDILYFSFDFVQVFSKRVLDIYCDLMTTLKNNAIELDLPSIELVRIYPVIVAGIEIKEIPHFSSIIRYTSRGGMFINDINIFLENRSYIGPSGVYTRMISGNLLCRFPVKETFDDKNWIAIDVPNDGESYMITFMVKFVNFIPEEGDYIRSISHNPVKNYHWSKRVNKENQWYTVTLKDRITAENNPLYIVCLDNCERTTSKILEMYLSEIRLLRVTSQEIITKN